MNHDSLSFSPMGNPKLKARLAHQQVFPRSFINYLAELVTEDDWRPAAIGIHNEVSPEIRHGRQQPLPRTADTISILQLIAAEIQSANQAIWRFDLSGFQLREDPPNFNLYEKDEHYDWHLDFGGSHTTRKLSFIIPLSDPKDYEGGKLEIFPQLSETDRKGLDVPGGLILFPSYVPHRITPITRGRRLSLVGWAHGPSFR